MKVTYHIPTEQYGFVEVELDVTGETLPESYDSIANLFKGGTGPGIAPLAFSSLIDRYMASGTMLAEEYEELDERQQFVIQTIKKFKKRNDR